MKPFRSGRGNFIIPIALVTALGGGAAGALFGSCGPFTDVAADAFCPFVLEIFDLGITTGTTPATYDPTANVNRLQMAAFLSRTVDGVLKRGGHRAALGQFWGSKGAVNLGLTTVGTSPNAVRSDGTDVWVANTVSNTVSRVRGGDGKLLETWTGATGAVDMIIGMGSVLVAGVTIPGRLYRIDPSQPAGAVTTVASTLGNLPGGVAFDGSQVWTTNFGSPGSVSIVTPLATIPWTVTTITTGFNGPTDALYDGTNVWVTDFNAGTLLKLGANAAILQTVTVGLSPYYPVFDGANIWVPNFNGASVSVVRVSTGAVLATLTGSGLTHPQAAAFDGQRVLVTNLQDNTVSLWKAADLTGLGSVATGAGMFPERACSDGVSFWITISSADKLARF